MEEVRRPKKLAAILMTIAAVFSLASLVLKAVHGSSFPFLLQLLTFSLMILSAIMLWGLYIKRHIDYKTNRTLQSNNKED